MEGIIEKTLFEFRNLSELSKLIALSNIRAIIATEQAVKRQYGIPSPAAGEQPVWLGKTA
jgi:hypothetical protein